MNQNTKQRVVGTVVLLALALIFLPVILDGDGSYQRELASRIPEPPVLQVMAEPVPQRPVIQADAFPEPEPEPETAIPIDPPVTIATGSSTAPLAQTSAADTAVAAPQESTAALNPPDPALDVTGLPVGWSVRLGTFSNYSNARSLVERLVIAGYQAYARDSASQQGAMTAVFVGPEIDKAKADQLRHQLQEQFQLPGIVVRYQVDSL